MWLLTSSIFLLRATFSFSYRVIRKVLQIRFTEAHQVTTITKSAFSDIPWSYFCRRLFTSNFISLQISQVKSFRVKCTHFRERLLLSLCFTYVPQRGTGTVALNSQRAKSREVEKGTKWLYCSTSKKMKFKKKICIFKS